MSTKVTHALQALPAKLVGNSFSGTLILTEALSEPEHRFLERVLQLILPQAEKPVVMAVASFAEISREAQSRLLADPARLLCAYGAEAIAYCQQLAHPFLPLPMMAIGAETFARAENSIPARQIILFGPESVGKSTLARQLAAYFRVPCLDEYVRLWFDVFHNQCDEQDASAIIQIQQALHLAYAAMTYSQWIICDTNALSSIMWYHWYFGVMPDTRHVTLPAQGSAMYLLLEDDLPFVPDHQRKYPDRREFDRHHAETWLQRYGCQYERIGGFGDARLNAAVTCIKRFMTI